MNRLWVKPRAFASFSYETDELPVHLVADDSSWNVGQWSDNPLQARSVHSGSFYLTDVKRFVDLEGQLFVIELFLEYRNSLFAGIYRNWFGV